MQEIKDADLLGEPIDFPYMNEILGLSVVLVIVLMIIVWCLLAHELEKREGSE